MNETAAVAPIILNVHFPVHASSVRVCRRIIRCLETTLGAPTIDRAELIVSEVVTNAIRYGGGDCQTLILDIRAQRDRLDVVVKDCGPEFSAPDAMPGEDQQGGFGLPIVRQLSDKFEIRHNADGNEIQITILAPVVV